MRFTNKVLISTGAASGIAQAVCQRYVEDGGSVVGLDVNPAVVTTMKELDRAIGIQSDVSDEEEVRAAISRAVAEFGGVNAVYNGAAILLPQNAITGSVAAYRKMLEVNAVGTLIVTREAAPYLREAKGAVVNTSSVVVDEARNERSLYAATKGTIPPLTRHLAMEMAPNVRVNAVSPGFIDTDMTAGLNADLKAKLTETIPLGRLGTADEVAKAVLFLASDAASYVTGEVLKVNGGMYM